MKIQANQGRSNTGRVVLYSYDIEASVEDTSKRGWFKHYLKMELHGTIKLTTIATRVKLAIEMSGYTQTNDYLRITRGKKLPDSRTDEWRVSK